MEKFLKLLLSLCLFLPALTVPSAAGAASAKEMSVHFINVGQGDAIYIKAPYGEDILIDGGRDGDKVVSYLKKQKVKDIEIMISTHPDADHMGGLDEVLKAYRVKSVYAPKVSHTTKVYRDFLYGVKKEGLKIKTASKGVKLAVKGTTAAFVGPVKSYKTDLNNWSAVLKLTYGKKSFLFAGDAERKAESDMIRAKENLKADVLKVGHHGAKTSTSEAFLKAVKPAYAVISAGKGNQYGHPSAEVLNRLKKYKVSLFRTDQQGTIVAKTDGKNIRFNVKPAGTASGSNPAYKLTASLDNTQPKQNGTIRLTVKGLPNGTDFRAVFHYKTTTTAYSGKIGTPLAVKIGRATKGYKVIIDVSAVYKGKTYKTQTFFTPR
ncbi:putative hydrolase (metallo-beta-lactamase superfamily) [Caldibacillus debilis GB1]|jgi:competence protein ComEC|uniref:Putative hydrolase (Metallo-beta-lactamase superfamily) n=1 Tax=Caldibacillus debilis GB1 TaxID=1339248 RepID=A0A420VD34_9BACI|nr:putative hydrolase (metallo-beta-lactamase superfamily) [Caldibacillus debilis GB1]